MEHKIYFADAQKIPADHWTLKMKPDKGWIGMISDLDEVLTVGFKMNPTDQRGFRWIAYLIDRKNMRNVVNREPTIEEGLMLGKACEILSHILQRKGYIVQRAQAGNNADSMGRVTVWRGIREPYSTGHWHGWIRGIPGSIVFDDVVLQAPPIGDSLDMMGPKVKWDPDPLLEKVESKDSKINKVAGWMRQNLIESQDLLKKCGCIFFY